MKFDLLHAVVLSKWPFVHFDWTRKRFRHDQMRPYDFSVITIGRVLEFHVVWYVAWAGSAEVAIWPLRGYPEQVPGWSDGAIWLFCYYYWTCSEISWSLICRMRGFSRSGNSTTPRVHGTGSGMTRWGHMTFLLLLLDVFWNFMKFDMSHEGVQSKWQFRHSEGTRNPFRDDQMWPQIESVFLEHADLCSKRLDAMNVDIFDKKFWKH